MKGRGLAFQGLDETKHKERGIIVLENDRILFGEFLCAQREKKGYTQKDLAKQLHVLTKEVSEWERGVDTPDSSLLIPLSDILGVTVIELLQGRLIESTDEMKMDQAEHLVKKALDSTAKVPMENKKWTSGWGSIYWAVTIVSALEMIVIFLHRRPFELLQNSNLNMDNFILHNEFFVFIALLIMEAWCLIYGAHCCFTIKQRLPAYYDANEVTTCHDGLFYMRMIVPINNQNWPYIVRANRIAVLLCAVLLPLLYLAGNFLFPSFWKEIGFVIIMITGVGSSLLPAQIAAKKHNSAEQSKAES